MSDSHGSRYPVLTQQQRTTLADLVRVDERIRLLTARLDALPENAEVERLESQAVDHRRQELTSRRIAHDMAGTLNRLQADAERLRARRDEDIAALKSDTNADRRRDLRHDLDVAERRLSEVENDIERERRTLAVFGHSDGSSTATQSDNPTAGDVDAALEVARRDATRVTTEITEQIGALNQQSQELRAQLPDDALARYIDGEREHGIGAAELSGTTCRCCCMELDIAALRRFANTAPDRVVSCPECGVLLIRPEA